MSETITRRELAKAIGVHPNTITGWANDGLIPKPNKVRSNLIFDVKSVVEHIRHYKLRCDPHGFEALRASINS